VEDCDLIGGNASLGHMFTKLALRCIEYCCSAKKALFSTSGGVRIDLILRQEERPCWLTRPTPNS
jgi:hypothetical protein